MDYCTAAKRTKGKRKDRRYVSLEVLMQHLDHPTETSLTYGVAKTIFKYPLLVEELVDCFNPNHFCKYEGMVEFVSKSYKLQDYLKESHHRVF